MSVNRGKAFEAKFKKDFIASFPEGTIDRLVDSVSGYKAITNVSDFIGYSYPNMFYLECKSVQGNTFPFTNLSQYDKLCEKVGIKGTRAGVILWFIDHKCVCYVPVATITKMKEVGKKSVNIKHITSEDFKILIIPTEVQRVFPTGDYSVLMSLEDGD